jgi:hypothetical protein
VYGIQTHSPNKKNTYPHLFQSLAKDVDGLEKTVSNCVQAKYFLSKDNPINKALNNHINKKKWLSPPFEYKFSS